MMMQPQQYANAIELNHTEHMYMKSNNKIKLLALDVDGTLFDNTGHIPEQNIKAIKKHRKQA